MGRVGVSWSRIGNLIPLLLGITVVSFWLIRLVPGDPAQQILGNRYTPEAAAAIRETLGPGQSIAAQYGLFLRGAPTGSFGESYQYHRPVGELLLDRVGPSLLLVALTAVLCTAISVPLGLWAGVRRGGAVGPVPPGFLNPGLAVPALLLGVGVLPYFWFKLGRGS